MNVYSLRIFPQIKLKFCEMLGIASAYAIQELGERLIRLDQKMDRFEAQVRKLHRRQMVLESAQARLQEAPAKASGASAAPASRRTKKKSSRAKAAPKGPDNVTPLIAKAPVLREFPVVLMIQSDARTQAVVRDYFKGRAKVISVDAVAEIPEGIEKEKLVGIFFERNLLSNEAAREILKEMQANLPGTRLVGVSNYLTLALAKAADVEDNFATFLTQPVSAADLTGIFPESSAETPDQPSAIAGKD